MINFTDTAHCSLRVHCKACRQDAAFRQRMSTRFAVPSDFEVRCPFDPPGLVREVVTVEKKEVKVVQAEVVPAKEIPSSTGTLVTVSVTGFSGSHAPNGTWTLPVPNPDGFVSGVFTIKLIAEDQGWKLDIFKRCCGNRLTLFATGKSMIPGQPFEVIGETVFQGQKGIGSLV